MLDARAMPHRRTPVDEVRIATSELLQVIRAALHSERLKRRVRVDDWWPSEWHRQPILQSWVEATAGCMDSSEDFTQCLVSAKRAGQLATVWQAHTQHDATCGLGCGLAPNGIHLLCRWPFRQGWWRCRCIDGTYRALATLAKGGGDGGVKLGLLEDVAAAGFGVRGERGLRKRRGG